MKKLVLLICVEMGLAAAFAAVDFSGVTALADRLGGTALASKVTFAEWEGQSGDKAQIVPGDGAFAIKATSVRAASYALGKYLRDVAKGHVSWCGNRAPQDWVLPTETIDATPPYEITVAYNYCTLAYTMAFWGETEWRQEIDRLALLGFNVALVEAGLPRVWQLTLAEMGFSDEQIKAFIPDEAAQPWWNMGNLEGLGGPLSDARIAADADLGKFIATEMRKVGIEPILQGFVGLVPTFTAQVLDSTYSGTDGYEYVDQGNWCRGVKRPILLSPLSQAYRDFAAKWYKNLEVVYGFKPKYLGGDLFHEGGSPGSLNVPACAKAVQDIHQEVFPGVTWVLQSWQGSPEQGVQNGVDPRYTLVEALDMDMSNTGAFNTGYKRNYKNQTTGEYLPWVWVEVMNFGGNTGMYGGMKRYSNIGTVSTASGIDAGSSAVFKGYGNLSEGFETNPTVYELYMSAFMRDKSAATLAEADRPAWFRAYQERRWGYTDDALVATYGTLATTVWQSHTYNVSKQQGVIENILCASPSYGATKASQWGPAYTTLPYEPTDLMAVAQTFLATMEAHPELLELETFRYDMVEFFAQLLADRARVILKDCVSSGSKRAEFLNLIDLSEKILACSNGFRLDAKENRTKSVAGDDGVAAYRRMVTTWMGSYQRGQDTQLHEYAHRAYAGLMKDYYKKRWEAFFKSQTGEITSAAYVNTLKALDDTFPTAALTPTANGNLKEIAAEIVDFLTPQSLTWNGATDNTFEGANWTNAKGETVAWEDGKSVVLTGVNKTIAAQNPVTIGNVELTTDMTTAANVYGGTNGGYVTTDTDLGWTGLTLDDLASAKYTGIMSGAWMGGAKLDCSAYHVKKDGDSVTMQFQVVHDSAGVYTKVVAVKLSINDAGHVIGNYLWANNGAADALGREFKQTDTPANGAPNGYQGADPKYGMIGISRCPASSVTVTGPVSITGEVTLNLGEAVSFPGATMIDAMVLENGDATLVLGANQDLTINVVNALNGSKLVLKGTAATLQGASGAAKVKMPQTALANVVYVGPDGEEQALKLDAEGYAKTKVGTMSFDGTISNTNLGWKNITLADLYDCVYTSGSTTAAYLTIADDGVTIHDIADNHANVTLSIAADGTVQASAYPGIVGLTATPAVARVETLDEGTSGGATVTYKGTITNTGFVDLGWTGVTVDELVNYTWRSGETVGTQAQVYGGSLNVNFGGVWITIGCPGGVFKASSSTNAFEADIVGVPPGGSGSVATIKAKNYATLTSAITAANGAAKVTLLDDATVTSAINNSYKTWIEIPRGLTLTATCGDFIWWDKAYTLDIYGTLDLGGNALSVGTTKSHVINLYAGGEIKSTNAKGLAIFDANTAINVKANDGFETATLNTPVQARQNTAIAVEEGVTAVLNGNIVLKAGGESGVANPVVTKTGAGTLEFNGAIADGASLVHSEGTLAFTMTPGEVRVVTVANAQAVVDYSSTDEDYEIVDTAVGNVHTYTSAAIPWVAAVGEERVDTGWIKYRTYKEALAVVKAGQCVYVLDETCIPEGTEITSGPAGSYLTIKDGYKVDAEGNVVPDVKLYYTSTASEWKIDTKVSNTKNGEATVTTKAGDIVMFDKGGEFGPIYIHGKSGEKVPVAGFEVLSGTLKVGYEGGNASIPEGWVVTVADGAAVQFDNWAAGWPVKVMDATFNGEGAVRFGSTITTASSVTFGTIKGDATITVRAGITVNATSIANPVVLEGGATVKAKNAIADISVADKNYLLSETVGEDGVITYATKHCIFWTAEEWSSKANPGFQDADGNSATYTAGDTVVVKTTSGGVMWVGENGVGVPFSIDGYEAQIENVDKGLASFKDNDVYLVNGAKILTRSRWNGVKLENTTIHLESGTAFQQYTSWPVTVEIAGTVTFDGEGTVSFGTQGVKFATAESKLVVPETAEAVVVAEKPAGYKVVKATANGVTTYALEAYDTTRLVWSSGTLWKSSYAAGESPVVFKDLADNTVSYSEGKIVVFKQDLTPWLADAAAGKPLEIDGCTVTLMNEGSSKNSFDGNAVSVINSGVVEFQNRWNGTPVVKGTTITVASGATLRFASSYAPKELLVEGDVVISGAAADITIPKFELKSEATLQLPTDAKYEVVTTVDGKKVQAESADGVTTYTLVPAAPTSWDEVTAADLPKAFVDISEEGLSTLKTWAKGVGELALTNKENVNEICFLLNIKNDPTVTTFNATDKDLAAVLAGGVEKLQELYPNAKVTLVTVEGLPETCFRVKLSLPVAK